VDKATIQVAEWNLKVIFYLLTIPKFDFGDVEKAMFFKWSPITGNFVFFSLTNPKCYLGEVKKRCLKGSHVTLNSFSAS